jgi:hypothetical protein
MYLFADPEAIICAARMITRDWGSTGYAVSAVTGGPRRSVVLEVTCSDGGRFHVGSTRHGNTTHADTFTQVLDWLTARTEEEARP